MSIFIKFDPRVLLIAEWCRTHRAAEIRIGFLFLLLVLEIPAPLPNVYRVHYFFKTAIADFRTPAVIWPIAALAGATFQFGNHARFESEEQAKHFEWLLNAYGVRTFIDI